VPNASLDIAFDGVNFYLIEFQCVYFGSFAITYSNHYWQRIDGDFKIIEEDSYLEYEYVISILDYISK